MNAVQPKTVSCDICGNLPMNAYHKMRDYDKDMTLIICETCFKNLNKYKIIDL